MKKNLKKCLALLLAVGMVMAMTVAVSAAQNNTSGGRTDVAVAGNAPTTGKLTINNQTPGATYNVYKVFSAEVKEGDNTYTWTPEMGFATALSGKTAEEIAGMSASELKALAASLAAVKDKPAAVTDLTNLALGYYLVVEGETNGLEQSQPILAAIPQVQGDAWVYDIAVTPKSSSTDFTKKIAEGNSLVDTNTKNIGDYVDYRLWADIPAYSAASYGLSENELTFAITDTMSSQLTYDSITGIKVYVINSYDETTVAGLSEQTAIAQNGNYTVTPETIGKTFTVDFTNNFLKDNAGKVVVVAFKAQLNENAVIGNATGADLSSSMGAGKNWEDASYNQQGNPNAAKLTFTNEFDVDSDSTTDEINDIVTTFTFGMKVKKVDADKDKDGNEINLKNAEFKVYTDEGCNTLYTNTWKESGRTKTFDGTIITGEDGTVTAKGFKDGTYYIKETKAPEGYKLYDGVIKVEIAAAKDMSSNQYNGSFTYTVTLGETTTEGLSIVTVEDEKGITLPGTGGIGTTIFTFGGLALVILAVVLFIVYTRKQKKQA